MATITSSGVGSGLQVNQLVTDLVAAERKPLDARIGRADQKLTTEFTALARLKAAMSGFQASLSVLKSKDSFELRSVSVGDDKAFTATATGAAATAGYEVEIKQLAKAAQLGSDGYPDGATSVVGHGKLTLSVGTRSFEVDIASNKNTLAGIRDAINGAPDNTGIRASLVTDVEGTHLVLTGTATGKDNVIKVAASGGDGGLAALAYDPVGVKNLEALAPAQDAIVFVSNYEIHSKTNIVSSAIDGVTLNLLKAEEGKKVSLAIGRDDAGIKSRLGGFVTAYNTLANQIASLRSYNADSGAAGPLLGDAMLRGIETQMRRMLAEPVAAAGSKYATLANIGITTQVDGTLKIDDAELQEALTDSASAVSALLTSESGVAVKLNDFLTQKLSASGELSAREAGITAKRKDLNKQKDAVDARMTVLEKRYLKQFTALDAMLAQMQSTSNYLTQQLASLPKIGRD